jgi:hypothetical protein
MLTDTLPAALPDTPLSALDFSLIRRLLAKSAHALDFDDPSAWAACFCEDGVFEAVEAPAGTSRVVEGRQALGRYAEETSASGKSGATRRWLNMPLIEGGDGLARVRSYQMHYAPGSRRGCSVLSSGIIDCQLRKVDGQWLYASFQLTIEAYDHAAWIANAMAGLAGCGCHQPHVDLSPGPDVKAAGDRALEQELILQVIAAFLLYMDDGSESARLAQLFTADGQWHLFGVDRLYRSGAWHGKAMEPVYRGRAAIQAFNQAAHAKRAPWDRHWGHAPLITIRGDAATVIFPYTTVLAGVGDQVRPMIAGVYHDRLIKIDGRWLIEDCAVFIERTPPDVAELVQAVCGQYLGGAA